MCSENECESMDVLLYTPTVKTKGLVGNITGCVVLWSIAYVSKTCSPNFVELCINRPQSKDHFDSIELSHLLASDSMIVTKKLVNVL